ncbi:MAG: polyribonucleotide nucleotidyltransferase [Gammaproteobacteria bacterium]
MDSKLFKGYAEVSGQFGGQELHLETGRIARQATGAVLASMGDIRVLATVVASQTAQPNQSFFPLTVNYQERMYATGRIPGSFFRREGRPTEKETLTSRLIDRPIRPLFPDYFLNEVQVVCTVLSSDRNENADIATFAAVSAALEISGVPFAGPIGACRVGYSQASGEYLLNPDVKQLETSDLDMVVAGTDKAVLMVESEACELSEQQMTGAIGFAHQQMQVVIQLVKELSDKIDKPVWPVHSAEGADDTLRQNMESQYGEAIRAAYQVVDKSSRQAQLASLKEQCIAEHADEDSDAAGVFKKLEKGIVREQILKQGVRIDGRSLNEVRALDMEVGILPGAHGSALFTRGETQTIATATLGATKLKQLVEGLDGIENDRLMLHYNFPPFSVGEVGFMTGPKRREIGHGRLARRSIESLLPDEADFPYTIRIVSDITESNGSSSMASVCGASLALMDAGVPLSRAVAGVAMGLVKEDSEYAVLTDILGDEDHLGDMDFKVAGTSEGITALQMDIKTTGLDESILAEAVGQARQAQLHILGEMNKVLDHSRPDVSPNAPKVETLKIAPDQVRLVIGKGGSTIKAIQLETKAEIEIADDGTVSIYGESLESRQAAIEQIKDLTAMPEVGSTYEGRVEKILDFGAFVSILPGKDGLVHISEIAHEHVKNIHDYLEEGQEVTVKLLEIDDRGRLRLSMKALLQKDKS